MQKGKPRKYPDNGSNFILFISLELKAAGAASLQRESNCGSELS